MQKKMLVTVSGESVTDFDILKAFMSLGLSVKIEAAPSETDQHGADVVETDPKKDAEFQAALAKLFREEP